MKIVADENIPFVKEFFKEIGNVSVYPGREINQEIVKDASLLLVRSVTKVNSQLLQGSSVKFAATATIGTDHIDLDYLKQEGIGFSSAPGSNADSVAEYVLSALLHLSKEKKFQLDKMKLGIIGVGNVGSRVLKWAKSMGIECLLNDPPKERETGDKVYLSLQEVLAKADIVTLHVPLSKAGRDATFHLADELFFLRMKDNAVFINTSRGSVIDEQVLKMVSRKLGGLVLDVFEKEPAIDMKTLALTDIATPHIAGYAFDGKVRGTQMIYEAACDHFQMDKKVKMEDYIQPEKELIIDLTHSSSPVFDAVTTAYPIMQDDKRLREINQAPSENQGEFFDSLRKNYPVRREFYNYTVQCSKNTDSHQLETLKALNFKVKLS